MSKIKIYKSLSEVETELKTTTESHPAASSFNYFDRGYGISEHDAIAPAACARYFTITDVLSSK